MAARPTGIFAQKMQHPERDKPPQAGCQAAHPRPQREQRQANLEDRPAADPVRERAGEHQQGGQHDRVGRHRPLQAGHSRVQRDADGRQSDIDDRVVQPDHEQAHAAHGEHQVPAARCHGNLSADRNHATFCRQCIYGQ
jgi:hypothetical protein